MRTRPVRLIKAYAELQRICTTWRLEAEHFSREHAKLWTRNIDLEQRNRLLQEQVALQRLIIEQKDEQLARGIRADEVKPLELLKGVAA